MARALAEEVREVQNPALCAALQWRCAQGFASIGSPEKCPITLLFLIAPMLFHQPTLAHVQSTQAGSGLRAFASKFGQGKEKNRDELLGLQARAIGMRPLSRRGLRIAIASGLIALEIESASALVLTQSKPRKGISKETQRLLTQAEKVGQWFRPLSLLEVVSTLRVRL